MSEMRQMMPRLGEASTTSPWVGETCSKRDIFYVLMFVLSSMCQTSSCHLCYLHVLCSWLCVAHGYGSGVTPVVALGGADHHTTQLSCPEQGWLLSVPHRLLKNCLFFACSPVTVLLGCSVVISTLKGVLLLLPPSPHLLYYQYFHLSSKNGKSK